MNWTDRALIATTLTRLLPFHRRLSAGHIDLDRANRGPVSSPRPSSTCTSPVVSPFADSEMTSPGSLDWPLSLLAPSMGLVLVAAVRREHGERAGGVVGALPRSRGSGAVHARSTTIRGRPESVDEAIAFCRDEVLPMCRELPGCVGLSLVVDRGSGRCIATTSWDSIESMRATTTQMQPIRQRAAEILGGTPEVAEWEIAVMHRDHRSADGACARVTWLRGDPSAIGRAADVFKLALMPEIETFDGFCGVSFLINRETGLAVTSVAFDSRAALEGTREQARGLRARGSSEARLEIMEVAEFELELAHLDVPELV